MVRYPHRIAQSASSRAHFLVGIYYFCVHAAHSWASASPFACAHTLALVLIAFFCTTHPTHSPSTTCFCACARTPHAVGRSTHRPFVTASSFLSCALARFITLLVTSPTTVPTLAPSALTGAAQDQPLRLILAACTSAAHARSDSSRLQAASLDHPPLLLLRSCTSYVALKKAKKKTAHFHGKSVRDGRLRLRGFALGSGQGQGS